MNVLGKLASCSEKLEKYKEALNWNKELLRAQISSRKNHKAIAKTKLRIFQLHVTISIDDDQPSPLVDDHTIMKIVKESHDCRLKCLYFFEMAEGSLLEQDSRTAIELYRSAFEHLKQLPKDTALSVSEDDSVCLYT